MRNAYDIALKFVQEQSAGEWGADLERKDASKLADLICADREALKRELIPPAPDNPALPRPATQPGE